MLNTKNLDGKLLSAEVVEVPQQQAKARYRLVLDVEDLVAVLAAVLDINPSTTEVSCVSGEVAFPLPMQMERLILDWEDQLEFED